MPPTLPNEYISQDPNRLEKGGGKGLVVILFVEPTAPVAHAA